MFNRYVFKIFQSHYCKLVFIASLFLGYKLLPAGFLIGWNTLPSALFVLFFAISTTCIVRNVKEKAKLANTVKSSPLSIISTILGFTALQVCGVSAPICGASLGFGALFGLLPVVFLDFIEARPYVILIFAVILQLFALKKMNCVRKCYKVITL